MSPLLASLTESGFTFKVSFLIEEESFSTRELSPFVGSWPVGVFTGVSTWADAGKITQ
jgi:hypothetical protein